MMINKKLYRKLSRITEKLFAKSRRKSLNNVDFSIICNNCWAGYVYRRFSLPYLTPTVGCYIFATDFCKLCENLKYYMSQPLVFISYNDSSYREILIKKNQTKIPIARLDDIEIVFLHYKSEEEAREKWVRRSARINYDNLIFKFSYMNQCSEEALKRFDALQVDKKICFVPSKRNDIKSAIFFKSSKNQDEITDDTSEYQRYVSIKKLINSKRVCGNKFEGKKR